MKQSLEQKRLCEKRIITCMVHIFCTANHHLKNDLCDDCRKIIQYVHQKTDICPVMQTKTFCSKCHIHCYTPEMQGKIRQIMRFAAPRMILCHPLITLKHFLFG